MGGISCNAEGFAGETGAVDVLEGGERDTNDLLSCSHYPLKGLAAGRVAGAIPHSDAASQDALDGAVVAISFIQTSSLSKRQLLSPNYNNKSNLFPCKRRSPRHKQYT